MRGYGEMADAPDLGSGALGRGGSSPLIRTTSKFLFVWKGVVLEKSAEFSRYH